MKRAHLPKETAKLLLDENTLNVSVNKAEDYTENDCNREKVKIFLCPDTMGQTDCIWMYGLLAVEHIIHEQKAPQNGVRTRTLPLFGTLSLWFVFTILAFGLMRSSFKAVIAEYAEYIACLISRRIHLYIQKRRIQKGRQLLQTLESTNMFFEEKLMGIKDIAHALVI